MEETALVKGSGDVLGNPKFFAQLKEKSEQFITFALVGGGKQINEAFQRRRFPIKFVDGSRVTENEEQKKLAEYILLRNQKKVQDICDKKKIQVEVIVPVFYIDSELQHVNGDDYAILATWLFDKVFVATLKNRLEAKSNKFRNYPIEIIGL